MLAMAAEDVAGKILAIFFPIMAFVAMGFDHVVANMFFLPAAIFAGVDITWWDAVHNWIFAFIGNLVGAAVFVAGAYWFLYARKDEPDEPRPRGVGALAGRWRRRRTPSRRAGDQPRAGQLAWSPRARQAVAQRLEREVLGHVDLERQARLLAALGGLTQPTRVARAGGGRQRRGPLGVHRRLLGAPRRCTRDLGSPAPPA